MRIKNGYGHKMAETGRLLRGMAAVFAAAAISLGCPSVSLADDSGTVAVESAVIRGSADASSNAVGSVTRGAQVTIKGEVTDASGTLWYQIYADANTTGYVRADLINKEGGGSAAQTASDGGTESAGQSGPAEGDGQGTSSPAENAMDAQYAAVSVEAALIRSGPSKNDSLVERLVKDTQVVVSGQSNGSSDGKTWYYITFTGADGTEKTGFVRSDLVTLGDMVPVEEEQPAPEEEAVPEPQETVSQDYELAFRDGEWYLLDNLGGYEQKLQPLLDATQMQSDSMEEDAKTLVRQRIAIVALAVLAVVLIIVVIIMAIKLRDAYYEDYEDEDEDDEEGGEDDEETPVRRRRRAAEDDDSRGSERPPRRASRESEPPLRRTVQETDARREQAAERRAKAAGRKAKNFLLDDDEFEFEFLNMDDKDL